MIINGIQKLTLLDYPGKVACTVFLAGCDLRCPYCHNSELWTPNSPAAMDEEEFFSFLKKRKGMLDGVCVTGGEPTLREDLGDFFAKIKELGYLVKLDSNGGRPEALADLIEKGLVDRIAMDVKNDLARYAVTCGRKDMDLKPICESISLLKRGLVEYEFRTTVIRELHDIDSIVNIGHMINGAENYFIQPFRDRDTVAFSGFHAPEPAELERWLAAVSPYVRHAEIRGAES